VHVACGSVLVLAWHCNELYTSGFVDDVMFSYNNRPHGGVMLTQQPSGSPSVTLFNPHLGLHHCQYCQTPYHCFPLPMDTLTLSVFGIMKAW